MSRLVGTARVRRLVGRRSDPCLEHRPALLGLVERALAEPPDRAALDHLDRCRSCRAEIAAARLAGYAVERAWGDASAALPSVEGWSLLKARVERRPESGGHPASPILALALAMGITVALSLPIASPRWSGASIQEAAPNPAATHDALGADPDVIASPGLPRDMAVVVSAEVQPLSADPVSAPRRPLASVGGGATVISPSAATGPTSLADQDPRRVGQVQPALGPAPVSSPRRFNVV